MKYLIGCLVAILVVFSKVGEVVYTTIMATSGDYERAHEVSTYVMLAGFILNTIMALLWYFFQGQEKRLPMLPTPPPEFRRPRMYGGPISGELHIPVPETETPFPCECRSRTRVGGEQVGRWRCDNPECKALHITEH